MAVDKNKVIAEATKLVQKGQFDKAIRAYEKILAEDAREVRILLKVGELQQKKGDNRAAADTFSRVADAYGEQGFFLKAVAVYKQMLKLAPEDVRVNERLAGLYQQLGILSDAMAQLQLVATAAEKAGDQKKLLDTVKRMVELDPDNVASLVKLGEVCAKQSETKTALEHFRRAAEQLKRTNRGDEYIKVAERIAFFAPDDLAVTRELADLYLAKGDTKRALAKLQHCFKADPKNVSTLSLLARAFKDLGQVAKTVSVYRELAHLHAEKGQAEEARAMWRCVLELAPNDAEALQATPLVAPPGQVGGPVQAAVSPSPAAAAAPPPPAAGAQRTGLEVVAKLLTETDVYLKYGLHQKALEHLEKVFAIDPDHLEAREKALEIRSLRKDAAGAAAQAVQVARIASSRGLEDRARAALARLRELAPDHPELAGLGGTPVLEAEVVPEEEELLLEVDSPLPMEVDDIALSASGARVDEVVVDEPPQRAEPPPLPTPAPAPRVTRVVPPAPPPATKAAAIPAPVPPVSSMRPSPTPAPPERARPAPTVAPVFPVSSAASPPPFQAAASVPPKAPEKPQLVRPPPAPPEPEEEEEDLEEELAEIEFFMQQGLADEAREVLNNLLAFYPEHSKLGAKLAALDAASSEEEPDEPPAPTVPAGAAAPGENEDFDLARELAAELGGAPAPPKPEEFQYSVADVFDQFKKGVAETVKAEDSETHYDLGIAYKEMGLLDDAVREFEVALGRKARKNEVDCLSMIGLCRMEMGDPGGAVKAYQRALRSDYLTPDAMRAVLYELAGSYVGAGDSESALYYLQKVVKVDAGYRDAKAMVERLGGGPGRPPPEVVAGKAGTGEVSGAVETREGPRKKIGYI